jgi:23S rRNA (guanosine2251-2'-O)-methyltransferase
MPILSDKNSILQTIRDHPEKARRLWIERGFERVCDDCIRAAKEHGVSFKVLAKEAFLGKFKGSRSHLYLEREDVGYFDPSELLDAVMLLKTALVCVFDGIFDPQNLGNIIRSGANFAVDGIVLPRDRSCAITEVVTSVSRGGVERVRLARAINIVRFLDELKRADFLCYGLDEKGDAPLWRADLNGRVCFVFGNESGLRRLTRERCDQVFKIPTTDAFPSLNVATSFAVSVYEAIRQRSSTSFPIR